eukprot:NODE_20437_length_263_cov_2.434579_g19268_i0.p2 GENE.NODE_20437_length_263_cov_2.434579_g19268_i0~~NODE_20437_length_263_cov_2.434579_g19268_i0.p2  ORF type:complete len:78 (-),score=17.04 NODE_20437_length_263_cov_2.434579_g19268_i0:28-231(-)
MPARPARTPTVTEDIAMWTTSSKTSALSNPNQLDWMYCVGLISTRVINDGEEPSAAYSVAPTEEEMA